jgi:deoxycytidine triphosphate deaminase
MPDRVFRDGSWNPGQLRGSGYDLRLADDLLVIPAEPGSSGYKAVDKSTPPVGEFTLSPGDSALVSTIERFSLDFDVAATIGPKFRWSAKGLLVLQGTAVHPGYGRHLSAEGAWLPTEDERLYFVVANVGPGNIVMRKGDPIAYLQIIDIEPPEEQVAVANVGFEFLRDRLFRAGQDGSTTGGLAYFRSVKDLQHAMTAETVRREHEWSDFQRQMAADVTEVKRQVSEAQTTIDRVNNTSNMIVVFGVFLVAVTLLGITLTTLIDLVEKMPQHLSTTRLIIISGLASLYAVSTIAGTVLVAVGARASLRRS